MNSLVLIDPAWVKATSGTCTAAIDCYHYGIMSTLPMYMAYAHGHYRKSKPCTGEFFWLRANNDLQFISFFSTEQSIHHWTIFSVCFWEDMAIWPWIHGPRSKVINRDTPSHASDNFYMKSLHPELQMLQSRQKMYNISTVLIGKPLLNGLVDMSQGQKSLHMEHLMLMIICDKNDIIHSELLALWSRQNLPIYFSNLIINLKAKYITQMY